MTQKPSLEHKPYENLWVLKTDNMIPNLTWWWWWWIFFIKDPKNPGRTRQLMILWSTKYTEKIQVMDKEWSVKQLPTWEGDICKFNGMTCAWWFDGKTMHDPLLLKEMDFEVTRNGEEGELKPLVENADYRFFGGPEKYTVNIKDEANDFHFEMTPWNDYMQEHRFTEKQYTSKYAYNILKIYGMKMKGTIHGEAVEGTAYQQRVTVNAPAPTWYWGIFHGQDGSYIEYFNPFVGPQIFRTTEKAKSAFDWGDISLSRSMRFYHSPSQKEFLFDKKAIKVRHVVEDDLPTFTVTAKDEEKEIRLKVRAYARAYWRFQQPKRYAMKSILYYNEYPAEIQEFLFTTKDGKIKVTKEDLGESTGNIEHTWGKLI